MQRIPSYRITPARQRFSYFDIKAKRAFIHFSNELLAEARKLYPNQIFRIMTDLGDVVMLPPQFADEIQNESKLSFSKAFGIDFHAGIPGFEISTLVDLDIGLQQDLVKKRLTKSLAKITPILSDEAANALLTNFGASLEWSEVNIKDCLLDVVARISSRIFLGDQLCHNKQWLDITKQYTANFFVGATKLRVYPGIIRRFVHWYIPECKKLRTQLDEARRVITPVVEQRRKAQQAAVAAGQQVPEFNDALEWADQEATAKGIKCDPATFQLLLSTVAIHTTTDLLVQSMICIAQHPDIFQPLREEISQVLRSRGWTKSALSNMRLLDSVIKESQRVKPSSIASMRRHVEETFQLSNGLVLKKGTRTQVDSRRMWDSDVHENPEQWDGYRFLRLRLDPKTEKMARLINTSPSHLGFGHGEHGCPGRFFAANEIKVVLCHLLIKYDWRLAPETNTKPVMIGLLANANPTAKIQILRREQAELDLDVLLAEPPT
ncbi:cytochrome P450 [Biscogniauxia marginata]|nr:cytochrome P450 [Biscogniauxia marginata]